MVDNIESVSYLVALAVVVGVWLALGIRDRIHARRDLQRRADILTRMREDGLCAMLWQVEEDGVWVVCARRYEHTGPHLDHSTRHLHR